MNALEQAPSIIANLNNDPTNSKEATGKVLSLAASGASIGAVAGPLGAGIGAVLGTGAGIVDNIGYKQEFRDKEDKRVTEELDNDIAERTQNYYLNRTADQIKSEQQLFAKANGYYNS